MLEKFTPAKPDPILGLGKLFAADQRPGKIDLGVGVYKDPTGNTPIMTSVKKAEAILHGTQNTKAYKSLGGDDVFRDKMRELVLGDAVDAMRVATAQTPGGTGAIRQLYEVIRRLSPDATIWISDPTWPSHLSIAAAMDLKTASYSYFDAATRMVDFPAMMRDLAGMKAGDILLLHGCCHNPTGANLNQDQWTTLTDFVLEKNVTPFIDIAYQGFGDGLEEDAANLRAMAMRVPEMLLAASCSKNFGLYRDRVGCAMVICETAQTAEIATGNLALLNRLNYSFAPDHGAAIVAIILSDDELRAEWVEELTQMRATMLTIRKDLADALRQQCNSDRFDFLAEHRGMFSRLGLPSEQVLQLRDEHAMYVVGDSRINIAGLCGGKHEVFAAAVAQVASGS